MRDPFVEERRPITSMFGFGPGYAELLRPDEAREIREATVDHVKETLRDREPEARHSEEVRMDRVDITRM